RAGPPGSGAGGVRVALPAPVRTAPLGPLPPRGRADQHPGPSPVRPPPDRRGDLLQGAADTAPALAGSGGRPVQLVRRSAGEAARGRRRDPGGADHVPPARGRRGEEDRLARCGVYFVDPPCLEGQTSPRSRPPCCDAWTWWFETTDQGCFSATLMWAMRS